MMYSKIARIALIGIVTMHVASEFACAQTAADLPPVEKTWLKWAISGGLAIVVCLPAFLNWKRSHLT